MNRNNKILYKMATDEERADCGLVLTDEELASEGNKLTLAFA